MKEDHRSYRRNSFAVAKKKPEKFLFATAKIAPITAIIFFHIILHPAVLIYDFHIFITSSSSFYRFTTNLLNGLLPAGLLVQMVERCTGIAEVKGPNPVQARIFFFFSRLVFATSKVASITAIIFFHIILHPVVLMYDFHIFITSFLLLLDQNFFSVRRHENFKSGISGHLEWRHVMKLRSTEETVSLN